MIRSLNEILGGQRLVFKDDDDDGIDDYNCNGDANNFTMDDVFCVMNLTGRQVGNSPHKKLDIWATVQYFQNQPAVREEEDRTFNANGEIQLTCWSQYLPV